MVNFPVVDGANESAVYVSASGTLVLCWDLLLVIWGQDRLLPTGLSPKQGLIALLMRMSRRLLWVWVTWICLIITHGHSVAKMSFPKTGLDGRILMLSFINIMLMKALMLVIWNNSIEYLLALGPIGDEYLLALKMCIWYQLSISLHRQCLDSVLYLYCLLLLW